MDWLDLLAVQGTLQESSPTPQLKSINSSVLSFLHSPALKGAQLCVHPDSLNNTLLSLKPVLENGSQRGNGR